MRTLRVPPVAGFVRCGLYAGCAIARADRIGPDLGIVMIVNQPERDRERTDRRYTPLGLAYSDLRTRSYYGVDYY